jgi:hypothetical protein
MQRLAGHRAPLHARLKTASESWKASKEDAALVDEVFGLAEQFGK